MSTSVASGLTGLASENARPLRVSAYEERQKSLGPLSTAAAASSRAAEQAGEQTSTDGNQHACCLRLHLLRALLPRCDSH